MGIFKFISQYKDHYKPISTLHGMSKPRVLYVARGSDAGPPNEVDLSFSGSQWLLSSQACCRRDLR